MEQSTRLARFGTITVVLADDDVLVRDTMRRLLVRETGIELLADAASGTETLDLVQRHRPDVLVLDHGLPDMTALAVLQQLPKSPRVLVYTGYNCPKLAHLLLQAGAGGFMVKVEAAQALAPAIRLVAHGHAYVSESIAQDLWSRAVGGTNHSKQATLDNDDLKLLRLLADGTSIKIIGKRLVMEERNVHYRITHLRDVLQLASREEVIAWAAACGFGTFAKAPTPPTTDYG